MFSKYRVWILLALVVVSAVVFILTGVPYGRFGLALAQIGDYSYDDEDDSPNIQTCPNGISLELAAMGAMVATTSIYWEPVEGSKIGSLTVEAGQHFWIIARTEESDWYQIVIACELVWVPATTIVPDGPVEAVVS